jgi:hypothetical protein
MADIGGKLPKRCHITDDDAELTCEYLLNHIKYLVSTANSLPQDKITDDMYVSLRNELRKIVHHGRFALSYLENLEKQNGH